jgi:hypothetical protein
MIEPLALIGEILSQMHVELYEAGKQAILINTQTMWIGLNDYNSYCRSGVLYSMDYQLSVTDVCQCIKIATVERSG